MPEYCDELDACRHREGARRTEAAMKTKPVAGLLSRLIASIELNREPRSAFEAKPDDARLLGTITLAGAMFHVDCIALVDGRTAVDLNDEDSLNNYCLATGNHSYQTVEFNGREYAVFIHPYQR